MKKLFIYTICLSVLLTSSCKQINKWFGKSSMSDKEISTLIFQKQELERRIKNDSANYERELETLRQEYEQKLASFEKTSKRSASGFFVVVGSFKQIRFAESFAAEVKSMGYDGQIIDGPNSFNCVTSATFKTLKESLPALRKARESINPDAWIYIK